MSRIQLKRVDLIFTYDGDYKQILQKIFSKEIEENINEMIGSGIKGRGGAGFPTGLKWKLTADAKSDHKYVICNADEGEPGTFKDREILMTVPQKVLVGMAVCARCIGAKEGFI